jgi:hypothetical protein
LDKQVIERQEGRALEYVASFRKKKAGGEGKGVNLAVRP